MNDVSASSLASAAAASTVGGDAASKPVPIKVSAEKISVFYGEKQALFDVSIDIPECSVTSFIDLPDSSVTALVNRAVVKCREVAGTSSSVRTAPSRSPSADRARAKPNPAEITPLSVLHTVL